MIFCGRVPYEIPSGRFVKVFDCPSVSEWFEKYVGCRKTPKEVFGTDALVFLKYLLGDVIDLKKEGSSVLESLTLASIVRSEGNLAEWKTDDDERDAVFYWFDSKFASDNPQRVSYLLQNDWLPINVEPRDTRPCTYLCYRFSDDSADTELWEIIELPGQRIDDMGKVLAVLKKKLDVEGIGCRTFIEEIADFPKGRSWNEFVVRLSSEYKHTIKSTEFQCSKHICELRLNAEVRNIYQRKMRLFEQMVVFDDLWASQYPDLFQSLIAFKSARLLF